MRKSLVVSLFFLSVALLALFVWPDSVLTKVTRWQIERRCQKLFGQKLSATRIEQSGRTVIFYQPTFYDSVETGAGGAHLSANRLEVTVHCQPLRSRLALDIHFHSPRVQIVKKGPELPEFGWTLSQNKSFVTPQMNWVVEGGSLELYDLGEGRSTVVPLDLTAQIWPGHVCRVCAKSAFGEAEYEGDPWGSLLSFSLPRSDCTPLARALHFFAGERCSGLDLLSGEIEGGGRAWLPSGGDLLVEGSVELRDLTFLNGSVGLEGKIPRVQFDLHADPEGLPEGTPASLLLIAQKTICQVALSEGGSLSVAAERMPSWRFEFEGGDAKVQYDQLTATLDGIVTSNGWVSLLRTEGEMHFGSSPCAALEMAWPARSAALKAPHSHLAWAAKGKRGDHIDVELRQIGPEQAEFLQSIATCLYPEAADLQIDEGVISARIGIDFDKWQPRHIAVDEFELEELRFAYPPHRSEGAIASARGRMESDVTQTNPIANLTGWVSLRGADVTLNQDHHWEQVEGEIHLLNGMLKRASVIAHYREMEAAFLLHPLAARPEMHLSLAATGKQIAQYLPPAYSSAFATHFSSDDLLLRASVTPHSNRLELGGICTIASEAGEEEELAFEVNFDLLFRTNYAEITPERSALPPWVAALVDGRTQAEVPLGAGPLYGFALREGSVHGTDLPLERYAPVLALLEPYISVDGTAEMAAEFTPDRVDVEYEAHNVRFATPLFEVVVDQLGDLHGDGESATHSVEIASGEQLGSIPVCAASCWIREGDLLFPEVDGRVSVTNGRVEVRDIVAEADGVCFIGSLDLDRSNDLFSLLHLSAPMAWGEVCDAQKLCSRYSEMALWDLPIVGDVRTGSEGLNLYFCFHSEKPTELDIAVSGTISDAHWSSPEGTLSLSDGHLTFDYDHRPQLLRLRNVDGDLITARGDRYLVGGRGADICDVRRLLGHFDFSLYEGECEEMRCAGSCLPLDPADPDGLWGLDLDSSLTRIGSIHPHLSRCHLSGWEEAVVIEAHPTFALEEAARDLALLDLFPLLPDLGKAQLLLGEECSGHVEGRLFANEDECRIALKGEEITLRGHHFDQLELAAGKRGAEWWIDRCATEQLAVTGRIIPTDGGCTFQECAFEMGGELALLFYGDYCAATRRLDSTIIEGWARLTETTPLLSEWNLAGEVVGEGSLTLLIEESPIVESFALRLLPDHLSLDGTSLWVEQPIPLFGGHRRPLVVGSGAVRIDSPADPVQGIELSWNQLAYDPSTKSIAASPLHFSVPTQELPRLCKHQFPVSEQAECFLTELCPTKRVCGELDIAPSGVEVRLESGQYLLGGSTHDLVNPQIDLTSDLIELTTQFDVGQRTLQLHLRTSPSDYARGCAVLYDEGPTASTRPLTLDWHWEEEAGLQFDSIAGELCGLSLDLRPYDPSSPMCQPTGYRGSLAPYSTPGAETGTETQVAAKKTTQPVIAKGSGGGDGIKRALLAQGRSSGEGMAQERLAQGSASGEGIGKRLLNQGREIASLDLPGMAPGMVHGAAEGRGSEKPSLASGEGRGEGKGQMPFRQGIASGEGVARALVQGNASGSGESRGVLACGGSQGSGGSHPRLIAPMGAELGRLYWGRVQVDAIRAQELLPSKMAALLEKVGIGAGYELEGIVCLGDRSLPIGFQGKLYGQNAGLAHLVVDRLSADLCANRSQVALSNVQVADAGGTLFLPQLHLWQDGEKRWRFASPVVQLSEVTPTQLKIDAELPKPLHSVSVPRAEVRNFEGLVSDRNSWTGSGYIHLDSTISRTPLPGIFSLPADILGRLGLEPGNLTPAMGGVSFEVGDGRCYITCFHDLYSRSRNSQFFLAADQGRSYVDFDGNIEVALRMKQYNLLLKFTEMFLVSVRGTVSQPDCSLQEDAVRHQRRSQRAE